MIIRPWKRLLKYLLIVKLILISQGTLSTVLRGGKAMTWLERFLKICMEKKMSLEVIASYTRQMRGKTDEEKEVIAKKLVEELQE